MKVILLQDVARIGKRHSVVEVPDGYALNQLMPKRMAIPATGENLKRVLHNTASKEANASAEEAAFTAAVAELKEKTITVAADMNDKQHLFKAISAAEVVAAAQALGVTISAQSVRFTTPIKEAGAHEVTLVHGAHKASVTVTVIKK